jgi:2'-5' RNA ligase
VKRAKQAGDVAAEKESIRAFVALDFDATSVRRVLRVADRLRMASGAPSATWTPQDKMHLTLKFMGSLPADAVAPLGKSLGALVEGKPAPRPGTCVLEAFPRSEHANVVVLELSDPDGAVGKLAARVEKLALRHGVPAEGRAFRPHLTLARLKRPYDARRWLRPDLAEAAGEVTATRLVLYRSELGRGKDGTSLYVPLATFAYG